MTNPTEHCYFVERYTATEEELLLHFFSNVDKPVYALRNLPEVVKGALFARYSRSPLSLRRLFLEEFVRSPEIAIAELAKRGHEGTEIGVRRAEKLYDRIFTEYGDDSVSQLGVGHVACEQASNLLTKVLERGRLGAYLEQSTRYIPYDSKLGERHRYHTPAELQGLHRSRFERVMDAAFENYSVILARLLAHYEARYPNEGDPVRAWRASIRARACDVARGLLPAATVSHVGIVGNGQTFEALITRMRASLLAEARQYGELILAEVRTVLPSFMRRIDDPRKGGAAVEYRRNVESAMRTLAKNMEDVHVASGPEVDLVEWDPDAERKIVAAALYPFVSLSDRDLLGLVSTMSDARRREVFRAYVGERGNRRQKPGRALERSSYRFDLLTDYGGFRDLQRHRMLTIEWQELSTLHGYDLPDDIVQIGAERRWQSAMDAAEELWEQIRNEYGGVVAQYVVPFAYKIRFALHLNVREAMHLLELRTAPGGHQRYRDLCFQMYRLIRDKAKHELIAEAMKFVDSSLYDLGRIGGERRAEERRSERSDAARSLEG